MLLLWLPLALAHVPHATITTLAAPPGLEAGLPWLVTHDYGGASTIYRSDDEGDTWTAVGGDPARDELLDAGWTDEGVLVLLASTRYWYSADAGVSWESAELDAPGSRMATGDGLAITTLDGLYIGQPGGELELALPLPQISDVQAGPSGFAAVAGTVWVGSGTDWSTIGAPDAFVTRALANGTAVYAGADDGSVWRFDGAEWSACGDTPYAESEHANVVLLAGDGSRLFVGSAGRGPAVSDDECATWTDIAAPMDSTFTGAGAVLSDEETTTGLVVSGDHLIQAGWDGIAFSTDGGAEWHKRPVLAPDLLRGVAFSPDFDNDGVIVLGGFSGGVELTSDAGATWSSPSLGLTNANTQDIRYDPSDARVVYADSNHTPARSDDGGTSWVALNVPFTPARGWAVDENGTLWLTGDSNDGTLSTSVASSDDHGDTWDPVSGLDASLVWDNFFAYPGRVCGQSSLVMACSTDAGQTWTTERDGEPRVQSLVGGDGTVVYATAEEGIWTGLDGADPALVWDGSDDAILTLALADDARTAFAVTRGAHILKSDDRGLTWVDLGFELPASAAAIATRPGFSAHPDLLVASYDGGWLVNGGGLRRFARYQRLDDSGGFVTTEGGVTEASPVSALGNCTSVRPAATLSGSVRGTRVRLLGQAGGQSQVLVTIDGAAVATIGAVSTQAQGELLAVDGLVDDWHRVDIEGLVGEDLCLDGIEGTAEADGLTWTAPVVVPEPRCGCSSAGQPWAGGVLGLALIVAWRSRRTWGAPGDARIEPKGG